jgi:hypothetical protein
MVDDLIHHWPELSVSGTAMALTYVTAFPYHVRRRVRQKVRGHAVKVWFVTVQQVGHHARWVLWQATLFMPSRVRSHRRPSPWSRLRARLAAALQGWRDPGGGGTL